MTNMLLVAEAYNLEIERLFNEKNVILKKEAKAIFLEVDTILKNEKRIVINNGLVIEKDLMNFKDLLVKLIINGVDYDNFPKEIEIKQILFTKYDKFGKIFNEVLKISQIPKIDTNLIKKNLGIK